MTVYFGSAARYESKLFIEFDCLVILLVDIGRKVRVASYGLSHEEATSPQPVMIWVDK